MTHYAVICAQPPLPSFYFLIDAPLTLPRDETPVVPLFRTEHAAELVAATLPASTIIAIDLPAL